MDASNDSFEGDADAESQTESHAARPYFEDPSRSAESESQEPTSTTEDDRSSHRLTSVARDDELFGPGHLITIYLDHPESVSPENSMSSKADFALLSVSQTI